MGHLQERFGRERPRKLLALDGGGSRGVHSLEILTEIERRLTVNVTLVLVITSTALLERAQPWVLHYGLPSSFELNSGTIYQLEG